MKKLILLSISLMLLVNGYSQTTFIKTLAKGREKDWKIIQSITNNKDTIVYFYWGFRNDNYKYIVDIGSICFDKTSELEDFTNNLLILGNKENNVDFSIRFGKSSMFLLDFSNRIYIEDDGKYTTITKEEAKKLAIEIKQHINLLK